MLLSALFIAALLGSAGPAAATSSAATVIITTDSIDQATAILPLPLRSNAKLRRADRQRRLLRSQRVRANYTRHRAVRPAHYNAKLRAHRNRVRRLQQRRSGPGLFRNHRIP
jgi:hypothetical protein